MDSEIRRTLLGAVPDLHALNPRDQRQAVLSLASSVLDEIDRQQREPDGWEASDLIACFGYVLVGLHFAALTLIDRALAPLEVRSDDVPVLGAGNPSASIRALREQIEYLRALGYRAG